MNRTLDRIDRNILEILQQDARISVSDIAEQVGLSATPCGRRIKQLEESGLIARQVVLLDQKQAGLPMTVLVQISLEAQTKDKLDAFEAEIVKIPEVLECFLITGSAADYIVKIVMPSLDHYQQLLLDKLTAIPGIRSIISNFVIRQPVQKTALPLRQLSKD
ncbi:MAG: Lrp/AsnC family transcriptional regulator [Motiliproteus sp.]